MSRLNNFFQYADDTTLVVPEHTDVSICDEFEHMKVWASINKLVLNLLKTKEILFKRSRHCIFICRQPLKKLSSCTVLNCSVCCSKMDSHFQYILFQCTQRMYLLKLLQHQGMSLNKLRVVVYSLIVSRIRYALPVWICIC